MGSDDKVFSHASAFIRFSYFCVSLVEKPVVWFRENVVLPNRQEYYWYHEKIRRVPTVDECYTDDKVCIYEADVQYELDKKVDRYILDILNKRQKHCEFENPNEKELCSDMREAYSKAAQNFFIKYGDLGRKDCAFNCLIKQKNRMAFERRHGPVGSGRKLAPEDDNSYSRKPEPPC